MIDPGSADRSARDEPMPYVWPVPLILSRPKKTAVGGQGSGCRWERGVALQPGHQVGRQGGGAPVRRGENDFDMALGEEPVVGLPVNLRLEGDDFAADLADAGVDLDQVVVAG